MDEVQDKHGPSQVLLSWRETGGAEDLEQPSCSKSTSEGGNSSFSRTHTSSATVPRVPQCEINQGGFVIVDNSHPPASGDSCGGALDSGDKADELRSQYRPLLCVQISEPPSEVIFDSKHSSTFNNTPFVMATARSQHEQMQRLWSGAGQMDAADFSGRDRLCRPTTSQKPDSPSSRSEQQQPCLPYACSFCSRRYAHQCQLRVHERVHTGEKPFQCAQCGKSFAQFCSLKRHQMVHTGERPFPCPHCGKQFSTSTNLKVHQSVHTGEKKFQCSKCGKNFSFLSNLIRHQALHSAR